MKEVSTGLRESRARISLGQKLTIGLDLGDRSSWYCGLDEERRNSAGTENGYDPESYAGGIRKHAAQPDRAGDGGDTPPWLSRVPQRVGARSDRGPCAQRAVDRGEPEER